MPQCPDQERLHELGLRGGPPDEIERLARHLEGCEPCGRLMETLLSQDATFGSLNQRSTVSDSLPPMMEDIKGRQRLPQVESRSSANESATTVSASGIPGPSGLSAEEMRSLLAPAEQPDELGRLGGHRVLKVLGSGGMGVVFLAEDTNLERHVALKVMLPKVAADPSAKQRFLREARIAAKLKSDHVVAIHQVSEDRGIPFLAMELLEGMTLDEHLKTGRALTCAETVRIGREIAQGLQAAHEKGLIHRDIKPANLWIEKASSLGGDSPRGDRLGRLKILDFGLARLRQDDVHLTHSGAVVGTPAFMAPEQADGSKDVDGRADLFSLGCVLYRLTTGRSPFTGDSTMQVLMALATHEPAAPKTLDARIPQRLSDLIMQLLRKDPARRIASADLVIKSLQALEAEFAAGLWAAPSASTMAPNIRRTGAAGGESARDGALASGTSQSPRFRRVLVTALAVAVLLAAVAAFFGGTIIRIATNKGQLVIENPGDGVEVVIRREGDEPRVQIIDRESKREFDLSVGEYAIEVKEKDGVAFQTDKFTLSRGGVERVRVKLERAGFGPGMPKQPPITPKPAVVPFTHSEAVQSQEAWAKHLGVPVEIAPAPSMKLRLIPPGEFETGFTRDEVEAIRAEWKEKKVTKAYTDQLDSMVGRHRIRLTKAFYLATTEFSRASYLDLHPDKGNRQEYGEPVNLISWLDAVDTCNRLSKKHGLSPYYTIDGETVSVRGGSGFRLPTSAEWEFAYRAGTDSKTAYPWGSATEVGKHAWYAGNTDPQQARRCGEKAANPFGLFDMSGNVWEWCYDYHESYSRRTGTTVDPMGALTNSKRYRVLRGGSYREPIETLAPWFFFAFQEEGNTICGFRVARDVPATAEAPPASVAAPPSPLSEPPPLAEWLKGRTVLTVSQDGKGQFKTIQAALDALQPGQVVKVLDRGPYRETLHLKKPTLNLGLLSEVQTVLEVAAWEPRREKEGHLNLLGHQLRNADHFRLAGFALTYEEDPASWVHVLKVSDSQGVVVEDCSFARRLGSPPGKGAVAISGICSAGDITLRECQVVDAGVMVQGPDSASGSALIERCYLSGSSYITIQALRKVIVRHNVIEHTSAGIQFVNLGKVEYVQVSNNTIPRARANSFWPNAPSKGVVIRNNIQIRTYQLGLGQKMPELSLSGRDWQVGHNAYLAMGIDAQALTRQPGDILGAPNWLSHAPNDRDYLRIAADSAAATGGTGGAWPSYIGALSPGPAPQGGDWFTRIRERWGEK